MFQEPPAPDHDPFFAIVCRDGGMIFLKGSGDPLPNAKRYSWARWDAYLNVPDPDALADEFSSRGTTFSEPLKDTHDGLRGFESFRCCVGASVQIERATPTYDE